MNEEEREILSGLIVSWKLSKEDFYWGKFDHLAETLSSMSAILNERSENVAPYGYSSIPSNQEKETVAEKLDDISKDLKTVLAQIDKLATEFDDLEKFI